MSCENLEKLSLLQYPTRELLLYYYVGCSHEYLLVVYYRVSFHPLPCH